jgi:hypothetical protein
MNLTAAIANSLWLTSSLPAFAGFQRALRRPAEAQMRLLKDYLAANADTGFGRRHGFSEIKTYEEFARRVPLAGYDDLEPWIKRIQSGENRVLTAEPVTRLVPTSGSTGARKLIPFTTGLQREFNRAIGAWITDLYRRHPSIAPGKAYWSISPAIQINNYETSAVPVGFDDDSACLGIARKHLVDAVMAVPSEIRFVPDMEQFQYVTLLGLLRQPELRLISIWHPSFLSLLLRALPGFWDDLLRDIRLGGSRCAKSLPPVVLQALKLHPLPQRARCLAAANPMEPETFWPNLKVISCWGDGHAALAKADLERHFPSAVIQSKGLLATECFVTIPFAGFHPLAVTSHFFEFIDEQGRIYLAHELEKNETYEVVLTTAGGLWRYRLQDLVQVIGFVDNVPSLRFLGRAGNVSDRCGEKLSEHFVAQAIHTTMAAFPSQPRFAMLAPDDAFGGCHYTLYVEGDVTDQMGEQLEKFLCENIHYAWCRKLGQLQPPQIFKIENGAYETFIAQRSSNGRRIGDIKPCALSTENGWTSRFRGDYLQVAAASKA